MRSAMRWFQFQSILWFLLLYPMVCVCVRWATYFSLCGCLEIDFSRIHCVKNSNPNESINNAMEIFHGKFQHLVDPRSGGFMCSVEIPISERLNCHDCAIDCHQYCSLLYCHWEIVNRQTRK